jgi:hypothetical protein
MGSSRHLRSDGSRVSATTNRCLNRTSTDNTSAAKTQQENGQELRVVVAAHAGRTTDDEWLARWDPEPLEITRINGSGQYSITSADGVSIREDLIFFLLNYWFFFQGPF